MVRKHDEAPEWFLEKNYAYLSKLDAAGWLQELQRRAFLDSEAKKRAAHKRTFEGERKSNGQIPRGFIPCDLGAPPVEIVDKADSESLGPLKKHVLLLRVWLLASDADIVTAFNKELRRAREQYPSLVKKPGPQALNGEIGKAEFARWRKHKIVEISDLLDWAARKRRKVSNADLGRWLFENGGNPDQAVINALKERQRALALIHTLLAHVVSQ